MNREAPARRLLADGLHPDLAGLRLPEERLPISGMGRPFGVLAEKRGDAGRGDPLAADLVAGAHQALQRRRIPGAQLIADARRSGDPGEELADRVVDADERPGLQTR